MISSKYKRGMQSLYEKYEREVKSIEQKISQAREDKKLLTDLMTAIKYALDSEETETEFAKKKRQSRLRHAKPEYRGYSFETAVIAILSKFDNGLTIIEIAREMALPNPEAINSIYKSIRNVCLRSDELLRRKGDRYYLQDKPKQPRAKPNIADTQASSQDSNTGFTPTQHELFPEVSSKSTRSKKNVNG